MSLKLGQRGRRWLEEVKADHKRQRELEEYDGWIAALLADESGVRVYAIDFYGWVR